MPEGFHGKMASRMDLPKRSGWGLGVIAGKPRAEHPKGKIHGFCVLKVYKICNIVALL